MDENKSFRCSEGDCSKAFWFKSALKRHVKNSHMARIIDPNAPVITWGCSECSKVFSKVESLRRHYRTTHGNIYVYPCTHEGCGQMFQRKDNLRRHTASHGENKNNCETCGKSFARKDALTRHKSIHTRQARTTECMEHNCSPSQVDESPSSDLSQNKCYTISMSSTATI